MKRIIYLLTTAGFLLLLMSPKAPAQGSKPFHVAMLGMGDCLSMMKSCMGMGGHGEHGDSEHSSHEKEGASEHAHGEALAAQGAEQAFSSAMQGAMENYLGIQQALSQDSLEGVSQHAQAIKGAMEHFDHYDYSGLTSEKEKELKEIAKNLKKLSSSLSKEKDIEKARETFGKMSDHFISYQEDFGAQMAEKYPVYYCSMAKKSWLQKDAKEVANPYLGSKMLKCGELVTKSA